MKFLMLVCVEEDRFENEAAAEAAAAAATGSGLPGRPRRCWYAMARS
jgi:hypothetical protein